MQRITSQMLSTVGDVAAAARRVWPDAAKIHVGLGNRSGPPTKTYRVVALADNDVVLGQFDAATLYELKARLEMLSTVSG
jgi:hypothetical protein